MNKVISLDKYRAKKIESFFWFCFWNMIASQNDDGPLIA